MSREKLTLENTRKQMEQAITRKIGLNESIAAPIASAVLDAFREHYAGREIYIPARSRDDRNERILRTFNGRNHHDLMKEHGLSRRQLNRILFRRKNGE